MPKTIGAHIVDIVRFMPPRIVQNAEHSGQDEFFRAPKERRFAFPEFSAADLGVNALKVLIDKHHLDPLSIDAILYSNAIADYVNIAIGPDIQHRVGAKRATVLQVDTGCVSYLSMLNVADAFIRAGTYQTIIIVTVTNFVSRLNEFQQSPKSWVLGDGASATLIRPGEPSILASTESSHGDNYGLMLCQPRDANNQPENYWNAHTGELQVEFTPNMVDRLRENAVGLVTQSLRTTLEKAGLRTQDLNYLITHQPNVGLMQKWRDAMDVHEPRVFDTFQSFGNLFQSSIPVTLSVAIEKGLFKKGDRIALGTFANGGDFAGSMVIQWGGEKHMTQGPWSRDKLLTNGIGLDKVQGLYLSEHHPMPDAQQKLMADTHATYDHEAIFGDYINVNTYINCPVDIAYEYCANVFSLEEWTFSVRDLKHVGDGLYLGREALAPNTQIYVKTEVYPDSRVIDYLCAWDQGQELWMRYYCRLVDAMPTFNKPGTVLMWLNCKHPHYVRGQSANNPAIAQGQSRQDRPWVGDIWQFFGAGHRIEAENLKRILETRFKG